MDKFERNEKPRQRRNSTNSSNIQDPILNEQINLVHSRTGFWANSVAGESMEINTARMVNLPPDIITVAENKARETERSHALVTAFRGVFAAKDVDGIMSALNSCPFI